MASPDTRNTRDQLLGLTCMSASDCWAAGTYYSFSVELTLAEHWNGRSWTVVATPNTSATEANVLTSVACASSSDCWAAGYTTSNWVSQTLTEHWNGASWAIVASPDSGTTQDNKLLSVTCVSSSDCWAAGYSKSYPHQQPLTEHWDGQAWTIVPVPVPSSADFSLLTGVTCVSTSNCWAAGYSHQPANYGGDQTLTEQWNGQAWSIVASPDVSTLESDVINGVTCVSASDCWIAGFTFTDYPVSGEQTLTEHWNGTSWAIVGSPNTSITQRNVLTGLTCASTSDCWTAGYYNNGSTFQTLIEQWNGQAWTIVASPDSSATQPNVLSAVTCASASECWAAGDYKTATADDTLIERYY